MREAIVCDCFELRPGSRNAVSRVAASKSDNGRGMLLVDDEAVGNGRGGGSGQRSDSAINEFALGISSFPEIELIASFEMGKRALEKKSFADLVR